LSGFSKECMLLKVVDESFSNIQIVSQAMDSYRKKTKAYTIFFPYEIHVKKKQTEIIKKRDFFLKVSFPKKKKELL